MVRFLEILFPPNSTYIWCFTKKTFIDMSTFTLWTVYFHPLNRPLSFFGPSTSTHKTVQVYRLDRPLSEGSSTFRWTIHFLEDRPLSVKRPSTFCQKTVHFNPGPSTFRWTVHFPPFGLSTLPRLIKHKYSA